MSAALVAAVGLAGGAGAVARVALDGVLTARRPAALPWPTLVVNVLGSLLLGLLTGAGAAHGRADGLRTVLGTGFCGGFTTFSTVSVAAVRLVQDDRPGLAALDVLATLVLTTSAAAAGLGLAAL